MVVKIFLNHLNVFEIYLKFIEIYLLIFFRNVQHLKIFEEIPNREKVAEKL